jgi:hypothetical protein
MGKVGNETSLAADSLLAATVYDLVTRKALNQKQLFTVLSSIHQSLLDATPELLIEIYSTGLSRILNSGCGSFNVVSRSAIKWHKPATKSLASLVS